MDILLYAIAGALGLVVFAGVIVSIVLALVDNPKRKHLKGHVSMAGDLVAEKKSKEQS